MFYSHACSNHDFKDMKWLRGTMKLPKEGIWSMYARWVKLCISKWRKFLCPLCCIFLNFFVLFSASVRAILVEGKVLPGNKGSLPIYAYNLIWSKTWTIFTSLDTHKPYTRFLFSSIYSSEWCLEPIIFTGLGKHKFGHSCTCEGQWSHVL